MLAWRHLAPSYLIQVTSLICLKLQLKNGSLRYSSQTFDLPASDSGLRMSSSRIAPPPPPATVIVSIINNDMFRSGNALRECLNRSIDLVIKIKKAKISDGRVWAIELHTTGAVIWSLWKSDESAQYSGVCLFLFFFFLCCIIMIIMIMLIRRRRSPRATCNPPPPPPT